MPAPGTPTRSLTPRGALRLAAAALAALVVLAACARLGSEPAASGAGPGVWDSVLAGIQPDGTVPLPTALQAFSLAIAPLPGVAIPGGPRESIDTGGGPLRWVLGRWSQLTAAQQAAVRTALRLPAGALAAGGGGPRLLACTTQVAADSPGAGRYRALVNQALAALAAHLGPLDSPTYVVLGTAPNSSAGALASAAPLDCDAGEVGPEASCTIYVSNGAALSGAALQATITHEVFHCYQAQMAGSVAAYYSVQVSPWIVEGMAEWVGEEVAGGTFVSAKWWRDYLTTPGRSLFARSYDAIGFYAHLAESQVDPWTRFQAMLRAPSSAAAYAAAGGTGARFLDTWASGYAREPSWGSGWDTTGPGITGDRPSIQPLVIGNSGGGFQPTAGAYANHAGEYDLRADVVLLQITGHGRLRTAAGSTIVTDSATAGAYCALPGGCACPPGSTYTGPPLARISPGMAYLALTGGPDGASASLNGESIDSYCRTPPSPSPTATPASAGGSCGSYVLPGEAPTPLHSMSRQVSSQYGGYTETLCNYEFGNVAVIVFASPAGARNGYQAAVQECEKVAGGSGSQPALGATASYEVVGQSSPDATPSVCVAALKGSALVDADWNATAVSPAQVEDVVRHAVARA